ncbi:MazG nucleotide pyrophosphohydrolase domain-containing protein [Geomicrobium sp. JCM 19039]|uniref:MazG nucleotide pyrophosphohydrolase domain-containing protein n=1 Tax=Geomicrobium sp. JCM 19039 TaxID=1460636 RepID=UPI00045F10D3|nr:MazG-like family protein [Geomicrobium sp. JCM 19039]GAK14396.1 hypothetical protein JCM19039_4311 [Geomicrobium sp. JCM 19039]
MNLGHFQQYVRDFCKEKGFEDVTDEQRYLYLMSEVGEVSDALLKLQFAGEDKKTDIRENLGHELFDVIWNAVEIANRHDIDLTKSFEEKMKINHGREW